MSYEVAFRLPTNEWPRAVFRTDCGYAESRVLVDGEPVIRCGSRTKLERGVAKTLPSGDVLTARLIDVGGSPTIQLSVAHDGKTIVALREDAILATPSRSAWIHAVIALVGSAAGFVAGYLYLLKARELESAWALKMAYHTAGWHLLLTLTLFPASVWGQRLGIRAVQLISAIFFCIHVGIALANGVSPDSVHDASIALLNAMSGVLFLASAIYGQRAHRDMDPVRALRAGRV